MSTGDGRTPNILTPDQRLRVFVSSTMKELAAERHAASEAIRDLRMIPVMFETGARPHPPRDLYRSYLDQSHIFVGIYWQSYGWIAPDMEISGLHDELELGSSKPRLIYVKNPAPEREPRLAEMLTTVRDTGDVSYKSFRDAEHLKELLADDLAILLTERFHSKPRPAVPSIPEAPVTRSSFVGREQDVAAVKELLRKPGVSIVSLWGSGGMGKTRLALETAAGAASDFPDGVAVVWLDGITSPDLVEQAIAAKLDIRERTGESLDARIIERIRDKKMLLVLDNFEHVLPAAPLLPDLLAYETSTKFLVTTRSLLGVRGEHAYEVRPLEVAKPGAPQIGGAVELFVERARAASPSFELGPENAPAVAEIARKLGGVPLAIELAATKVRVLSAASISKRLDTRLDLLKRGGPDLPARHRTIRDMIRWSYDLLTPEEKSAFEEFTVFVGGASLDAACAVLHCDDPDGGLELLASLVDKSLIRRMEDPGGDPRFDMLDTIREFGQEQLEKRGAAAPRDAHAAHFMALAADGARGLLSPAGPGWYEVLEREHENLQSALGWLVQSDRIDDGSALAIDLQWFWWIRGHLESATHWLMQLLAAPAKSEQMRAGIMVSAAMMAQSAGDIERSRRIYEGAVEIFRSLGDTEGVAWAETGLGQALYELGNRALGEELQRRSSATFLSVHNSLGVCTANTRLAWMATNDGDYEATEEYLLHSLQARRDLGDPWGTGYVLSYLGSLRIRQNDPDGAELYLTEALPLLRSVGSKESVAQCLDGLGQVAALRGDWDTAAELTSEALDLFLEMGARSSIALGLIHLGRAAAELGRWSDAGRHFAGAFGVASEVGRIEWMIVSIEGAACVLVDLDRIADGARLLGAADRMRDDHSFPRLHPFAVRAKEHIETGVRELGDAFGAARAGGRDMTEVEIAGTIASVAERTGVVA